MYIISKFKDYYDGAVGMGIDKSIVYERHTIGEKYEQVKKYETFKELMPKTKFPFSRHNNFDMDDFHTNSKSIYYKVDTFVVGFCGKYYLGFRFSRKRKSKGIGLEITDEHKYVYDIEEAKKELTFEDRYSWRKEKNSNRELIKFNDVVNKINNFDNSEIFTKYRTPIFLIKKFGQDHNDGILVINPLLKDVDFYKMVDTYTAFQEVQMYISGVLGTNEDGHDTPMTEKEKVQQHGFDKKYGFRTRPKG